MFDFLRITREIPQCRCGAVMAKYVVHQKGKRRHESWVCPVCDEARVASMAEKDSK